MSFYHDLSSQVFNCLYLTVLLLETRCVMPMFTHFSLLLRCPASNAYTTVLQNGNGTVSLLSVQIFKFVKQYIIYLHCQIQICVEIQQGSCRSVSFELSLLEIHTQGPYKTFKQLSHTQKCIRFTTQTTNN